MDRTKLKTFFVSFVTVIFEICAAAACFFAMVFAPFLYPVVAGLLPDAYLYLEWVLVLLVCFMDFLFPYFALRLFRLKPKWPWIVLMGILTTIWTLFVIVVLFNVND